MPGYACPRCEAEQPCYSHNLYGGGASSTRWLDRVAEAPYQHRALYQECPLCEGRGYLSRWGSSTSDVIRVTCHTCLGEKRIARKN